MIPHKNISTEKASKIYIQLASPKPTSKSHSDLTGRFPIKSNRGNQYLMIVYETTSNHIFAEPMKDRTAKQISSAYEKIKEKLDRINIQPTIHIWTMK